MDNKPLLVGVNIKCTPKEFENLLLDEKVDFFNIKIKKVKFYSDLLTYYFFNTLMSRDKISEIFRNNIFLKNIIEYGFYDNLDE